jgi:hypothetical protein
MADNWFFQQGEYEVGPLRPKELLEYIRRGTVRTKTMVRKDDSSWTPAGDVGGLFDAARKPSTIYLCPTCSNEVSAPPCFCKRCDQNLTRVTTSLKEHRLPDDQEALGDRLTGGAWSSWLSRLRKYK